MALSPRKSLGVDLADSVVEQPVTTTGRRGGRIFEKTAGGKSLLSQSSKFQLASSDVPEVSQELRVEGLVLAGWCMVKTAQNKLLKQRFLEIEAGVCRVYSTDPPVKVELCGEQAEAVQLSVETTASGEARTVVTRAGAAVLDMTSSVATARLVANAALGGTHHGKQICTVTLANQQTAVLWVNGGTAFLFEKRLKHTVDVKSLELNTGEHAEDHRLTCTKDGAEVMVISVPEPLLLLRWIAALTSCDTGEKRESHPSLKPTSSVMQQLVLQDNKRSSMQMKRTYTLGVQRTLGVAGNDEETVMSREEIRNEMVKAASFPTSVPPLKEVLADPQLRLYCYNWSKAQFSSENVKFWVACDNLLKVQHDDEKATGLRKIAAEFIASSAPSVVNISGAQRKRFLKLIEDAKTEVDLAQLLPGILSDPLSEIVRVMEFDIYSSLSVLMNEAIKERARPKIQVSQSDEKSELRSVRDMLDSDELLNALLLFAGSGEHQHEILFLTAVELLKKKSADADANQIFYMYCDPASPRYLNSALSFKRVNALERQMSDAANPLTADSFDFCVHDVVTHLDSGLFKRFLASRSGGGGGGGKAKSPTQSKPIVRLGILGFGSTGGQKRSPRGGAAGGGGGGEEKRSPRGK